MLVAHGGSWARDGWGYNSEHQMLANRAYAVISVSYLVPKAMRMNNYASGLQGSLDPPSDAAYTICAINDRSLTDGPRHKALLERHVGVPSQGGSSIRVDI